MSTETTQTTTQIASAAQKAAETHPANQPVKAPLTTSMGDHLARAERAKAAFAPKPETKTEANTETKQGVKPETKSGEKVEATETDKKAKTSLFDRKDAKAEVKTETKVEEVPGPEDKMELPEAADAIKKSQFTELKTITKQLRRELAQKVGDYENQLKTLKTAQPAEAADILSVRERLKQAEDKLAIVDLQNHPDFAKQYIEPKNKAIAEAKMLLTDNNITEGVDFTALMAKPRPEFAKTVSELASKMNDFDRASFTNAMREAFRLQGDSAQALTKSSELAQQLQQKSALQQKQAFEEVWGKLGAPGEFLVTLDAPEGASPEERQEITSYNDSVSKVRSQAESYAFGRLDERQAASLASKAATLDFLINSGIPRMEKEYTALRDSHAQLVAELKAIKGAKETGTVVGDHTAQGSSGPKTTLAERIRSAGFKSGA